MKCPVCQVELKIADRAGIEIDYCPNCRGVWLDRGELDKIIERHIQETYGRASYPAPPPDAPREPHRERYSREEYDYEEPHKHRKRKKRDWFEDLFDIFD